MPIFLKVLTILLMLMFAGDAFGETVREWKNSTNWVKIRLLLVAILLLVAGAVTLVSTIGSAYLDGALVDCPANTSAPQ